MSITRAAALLSIFPIAATFSTSVSAQRADDDATRQADDAFGFSTGSESVGLYNPDDVRGISPVTAGNVRIEGLYFDRQSAPSVNVVDTTTIRVGFNTLGYVLPAPSGVVDYRLREAPKDIISLTAGVDGFWSPLIEATGALADASSGLSVAGGAYLHPQDKAQNGAQFDHWGLGIVPRWRPNADVSVTAFYDRQRFSQQTSPSYSTAGPFLPPKIERGRFFGQDWTVSHFTTDNVGAIAIARPSSSWTLRVGAFRSMLSYDENFFDLLSNVQQDGSARRLILAYPTQRYSSVSGEAQIEKRWAAGNTRHTLMLVGRLRGSDEIYGGATALDLGTDRIDRVDLRPRPAISFGPTSRDRVDQLTGGATYRLEWDSRLDLSLGIQKTRYEKTFTAGTQPATRGSSAPWLFNGLAAWRFSPALIAYASYARGLEESGVAPNNASNNSEVLAAIVTTQKEVGVRALAGPLRVVATAFQVTKPYADLDARNRFDFVGEVTRRGIEASASGQPMKGLTLLTGAALIDAEITGEQRNLGLIGKRPITHVQFQFQGVADYALPFLPGVSLDLAVGSFSARTSRRDNLADIPPRTLANIGARYRFELGGAPAQLRAQILNVFDNYGITVASGQLYGFNAQRRGRLTLAVDL